MAWMVCKPRNSGGWSHRPVPLCPWLLWSVVCHVQECVTGRFFFLLIGLCRKGNIREGCVYHSEDILPTAISPSSQKEAFCSHFLLGGWFGNEVYLAGCLCWIIMLSLWCTLNCSPLFSWAEGIIFASCLRQQCSLGGSLVFCESFWIWHLSLTSFTL